MFKLPEFYGEMEPEEQEAMRASFEIFSNVMLNIFQGVMYSPRVLPLAAKTLKATANMLVEEMNNPTPREEEYDNI